MSKRRVCVCTSYAADREPRGPRHARAIWESGICSALTFIDASAAGTTRQSVAVLEGIANLEWLTHSFPTRSCGWNRWLANKIKSKCSRYAFSSFGYISNSSLNASLDGIESLIAKNSPEIIIAHNIDMLLPAHHVAQQLGAVLIFDSMEFHSDMGDEQDALKMRLIKAIEEKCLPACRMILTSSAGVATALQDAYGVKSMMPLYNTPAIVRDINGPKHGGFSLYWRNSTLGLGQRGLEEAIRALSELPEEITLHLQGRIRPADEHEILTLVDSLNVRNRIVIHPPCRPENAVASASRFHVGLCLERPGIRNHELTVSNKMFDYHMAGLAVVSSNMPALKQIVARSGGGVCYVAGDYSDLARVIRSLYDDPSLYRRLVQNARQFALTEGNLEHEMMAWKSALLDEFCD